MAEADNSLHFDVNLPEFLFHMAEIAPVCHSVSVRLCVRAGGRACVYVRTCIRTYVRTYVLVSVRASVRVCVRE